MAQNTASKDFSCLEKEYIKLKRRLYTQFFTVTSEN